MQEQFPLLDFPTLQQENAGCSFERLYYNSVDAFLEIP